MKSNRHVIVSALQIISAIVTFVAFFAFVPWLVSHPIEKLARYHSAPEPPPNAESFSVNHGHFTFYDDSPSTNKMKALSAIGVIVANWAFLVISALYYSSDRKVENMKPGAEEQSNAV